jgi:glycosyltransferase involved in cell wall biosynthesis
MLPPLATMSVTCHTQSHTPPPTTLLSHSQGDNNEDSADASGGGSETAATTSKPDDEMDATTAMPVENADETNTAPTATPTATTATAISVNTGKASSTTGSTTGSVVPSPQPGSGLVNRAYHASPPGSADRAHMPEWKAGEGGEVEEGAPIPPPPLTEPALITIITPMKDTNPLFVRATERALFAQTFQLFRWVVVDDGSTQTGSVSVLNRYRSWTGGGRVLVKDCEPESGESSCGPSRARNYGLQYAVDTPYVLFLDDDDLMEVTYLETMLWALESNAEFAYANSFTVTFGEGAKQPSVSTKTWFDDNRADNHHVVTGLVRTAALRQISAQRWPMVFNESWSQGGEDWLMWNQLKAAGFHGTTVPEPLFWYRIKQHRRKWAWLDRGAKAEALALATLRDAVKANVPALYAQGWTNPVMDPFECQASKCKFSGPATFLNLRPATMPAKHRHAVLIVPWLALGGADQINIDILALLSKRGWTFTVVTTLDIDGTSDVSPQLNTMLPAVQKYTEDVLVLPHFVRECDRARFLHYLIRSRGADVVFISNAYAGYMLLPYLQPRLPGVAFVDFVHMREGWKPEIYRFGMGGNANLGGGMSRISMEASPFIDMTIYASNDELHWAMDQRTDPAALLAKQTVVHAGSKLADDNAARETQKQHNATRDATRKAARGSLGMNANQVVVLFSGRLVSQKQPLVMIRAFHLLLTKMSQKNAGKPLTRMAPDARLIIAGDGALRGQLESYVKEHGIADAVQFLGKISHARMISVVHAADIMLMTSEMEGIPVAMIEAMSIGVVPVSTNVGGISELVNSGSNGFLHRVGDSAGMVESLLLLAEDSKTRSSMSQLCRKWTAEHFSMATMQRGVVKAFETAMRSASVRSGGSAGAVRTRTHKNLQATRSNEATTQLDFAARVSCSESWDLSAYFGRRRLATDRQVDAPSYVKEMRRLGTYNNAYSAFWSVSQGVTVNGNLSGNISISSNSSSNSSGSGSAAFNVTVSTYWGAKQLQVPKCVSEHELSYYKFDGPSYTSMQGLKFRAPGDGPYVAVLEFRCEVSLNCNTPCRPTGMYVKIKYVQVMCGSHAGDACGVYQDVSVLQKSVDQLQKSVLDAISSSSCCPALAPGGLGSSTGSTTGSTSGHLFCVRPIPTLEPGSLPFLQH